MREMSPEMRNLLKSKKMIGDNRPTHRVILGGKSSVDFKNPQNWTTWRNFVINYRTYGNMEETNDGQAIISYIEGNIEGSKSLKIAYADSVIEVLNGTKTFGTGIEILNNLSYAQSTLAKIDGKLHMAVTYINSSNILVAEHWIDSDGNGNDFKKVGNISSDLNSTSIQPIYQAISPRLSLIHKLKNGNLVIIVPYLYDYFIAIRAYYFNGVNWIAGAIVHPHYIYGYNSLNFLLTDEDTFVTALVSSSGIDYICEWSNSGAAANYYSWGNDWELKNELSGTTWWAPRSPTLINLGSDLFIAYSHPSVLIRIDKLKDMNDTSINALKMASSWEWVCDINYNVDYSEHKVFVDTKKVLIFQQSDTGVNEQTISGAGTEITRLEFQAKQISINRTNGMSSGLNIVFDNKGGFLAPDGLENPKLLWPNKEIIIKQGYGQELIQTYKGLIDSIDMVNDSKQAEIKVTARDGLKRALDQTITASLGEDEVHVMTALDTPIENLWRDLAAMAGLEIGTVEETGITLSEKVFSWETYGDAFSWLGELVGFETVCDEEGITHFRKQQIPTEPDIVYEFTEGVDIKSLGYTINDADLYRWIIVHGKKTVTDGEGKETDEVIEFKKEFSAADYWGLLPQKVLKIDAPEADTLEKCEEIGLKAEYLMISRARIVKFQSIGIPHLQNGDFIRVTETSTTISEVYRITDLSTKQDSDTYTMDITCHWYSALVEEVVE